MRALAAAAVLALLLPAVAQTQPEDPGLAEVWQRALRDPLVALPLERPAEAEAAMARLDRLAAAFADSQRMLGATGSGPLLLQAAPDAAAVRGAGADRAHVAQFLSVAAAFRAGRLDEPTRALASAYLLETGAFIERLREPAERDPQVGAAWREAKAWYARLEPLASPGARAPRANVTAGPASPGGAVEVSVRGSPGNGTLVTPWGNHSVGGGSSGFAVPVPAGAAPGNHTGRLVVGGATVANVTFRVDPIALKLEILGPRTVAPLSNATYRVAMSSPVLVDRAGTFEAVADGAVVPVVDGAFVLAFPASGSVQVTVRGGPGPPWSSSSASFTVDVAAPAPTSGLGGTTLAALVAVPSALVLGLAALARARRSGRAGPATPAQMAAAAALAEGSVGDGRAARGLVGGLAARLRAWWSSPAAAVVADYRRAARILGEAGTLEPSATHAEIAAALEGQGVRPAVARRLAAAYEALHYAGAAGAAEDYWQARRGAA